MSKEGDYLFGEVLKSFFYLCNTKNSKSNSWLRINKFKAAKYKLSHLSSTQSKPKLLITSQFLINRFLWIYTPEVYMLAAPKTPFPRFFFYLQQDLVQCLHLRQVIDAKKNQLYFPMVNKTSILIIRNNFSM